MACLPENTSELYHLPRERANNSSLFVLKPIDSDRTVYIGPCGSLEFGLEVSCLKFQVDRKQLRKLDTSDSKPKTFTQDTLHVSRSAPPVPHQS